MLYCSSLYIQPDQPGAIPQSIQEWNSVLTIHLLKGNDLPPMDDNGVCGYRGVAYNRPCPIQQVSVTHIASSNLVDRREEAR